VQAAASQNTTKRAKQNPITSKKRSAVMKGIDVKAVGVATPAVLTKEMAEGCSDYVSSVVLMVRGGAAGRLVGW
jgi:hypothetical protein